MELASLVHAAQRGDLEAFGHVVAHFQDMAHAVAFATVGDMHLAEDAAQEAFIEAYLCLPKLREPAAFPGWFRRIVVKRADRLIRGKQPAPISLEVVNDMPSAALGPAALAEARELRRELHTAITALPDSERLITTLFYLADLSYREIAAATELPVTTVKKRLYDARQRLRAQMDELVRHHLRAEHLAHDERFRRVVQFFIAVRTGDLARVQIYLADDPALLQEHERWDENIAQQYGIPAIGTFTALHRAVYNGDHTLITFLLDQGADVDARTRSGQTPLHTAVICNYPEAVTLLLAAHADPNIGTDLGMTPLHWAVLRNRCTIIRLLLEAGADSDLPDRYRRTAFDWARLKGQEAVLMLLCRQAGGAGVSPDHISSQSHRQCK